MSTQQIERKAEARQEASIYAATYVREAREGADMTQKQLADELGVRASRLCDIEGRRERKGAQFAFDSVPLAFLFEVQNVTGRKLILKAGGRISTSHNLELNGAPA